MTDRETFTDLLTRAGIPFGSAPHPDLQPPGHEVLQVDSAGNVGGYDGFHSHWHFDAASGRLLGVAHWE